MYLTLKAGLKNLLPKTFFKRTLLIIITPVVIAQGLSTYIFYNRHFSTLTDRLSFSVVSEISYVIKQLDQNADLISKKNFLSDFGKSFGLTIDFLPLERLEPSLKQEHSYLNNTLSDHLAHSITKPFSIQSDPSNDKIFVFIELDYGLLKVTLNEKRLFTSTTYIFIFWMIGSSLFLFTISLIFMKNQVRPITALANAAEDFGKGREVGNFAPKGASEIRSAAKAFLQMQRRIKDQIRQRTDMLTGVSHDLRTPLTRMKLALEMMPDSEEKSELQNDIVDMEQMITAYLLFAQGEGSEPTKMTNINRLIEDLQLNSKRKNIKVSVTMNQNIDAEVKEHSLKRALTNLINNAGRYGTEVWVKAYTYNKNLNIVIEDNGPGLAPKEYEDVFRPFYRVDNSRNQKTGGMGLGMTIANDIIKSHGGKIKLGKSEKSGLLVKVQIPL